MHYAQSKLDMSIEYEFKRSYLAKDHHQQLFPNVEFVQFRW